VSIPDQYIPDIRDRIIVHRRTFECTDDTKLIRHLFCLLCGNKRFRHLALGLFQVGFATDKEGGNIRSMIQYYRIPLEILLDLKKCWVGESARTL
jgi:hypothetical protein